MIQKTMAHSNICHIRRYLLIGLLALLAWLPGGLTNPTWATDLSCSGSGSMADPYIIDEYDDLEALRQAVAGGDSLAGKYVRLESDLSLPADWPGLGSLKEGCTETGKGSNIYPFSGILDGKGADGTIHTVTAADGGRPLFAFVRETVIRNLNIAGASINGSGLIGNYTVDCGPNGSGSGVHTADVSNVTIKSGTRIKGSGIASGYTSAGNTINITDCTVETGVTIGADGTLDKVGSFGGDFSGTITDCSSAADVYGKDYVGGIMGCRNASMSATTISGCSFTGRVIASGYYAGGIAGGSYGGTGWGINTAPNAPAAVIKDCLCSGTVQAKNVAGGILGYDTTLQAWDNGQGYLQGNLFTGILTTEATGDDAIAGGLAGQFRGLDKYNSFKNNYYADTCGADRAIGGAGFVDTSSTRHETAVKWMTSSGPTADITYYNTYDSNKKESDASGNDLPDSLKTEAGTGSYASNIKANHNRTDDPLGADSDSIASAVTAAQLAGEETLGTSGKTLITLLNEANSSKYWIQGGGGPALNRSSAQSETTDPGSGSNTPSGDGESGGTSGGSGTGGSGGGSGESITVQFTLLGDRAHPGDDSVIHTRAGGNLQTWIGKKSYTLDSGSSAWDLIQTALTDKGLAWDASGPGASQYGSYYIRGIQIPGTGSYLSEFTNGSNSGWMYAVNGTEPNVGVSLYTLEDGDDLILFYTDDYSKEASAGPYNGGDSGEEGTARQRLAQLLTEVRALEAEVYTPETYQLLQGALAAADRIAADQTASDDQIQAALETLTTARNSLVKANEEPAQTIIEQGNIYVAKGGFYRVTSLAGPVKKGAVCLIQAPDKRQVSLPGTLVLADGGTYVVTALAARSFTGSKIRKVTIGAGVRKLASGTFTGSRAAKLIVKTKKLTKGSVKGSLKGSGVKTIKVKTGSKASNRKYIKKYKKYFSKRNAGKKITVR